MSLTKILLILLGIILLGLGIAYSYVQQTTALSFKTLDQQTEQGNNYTAYPQINIITSQPSSPIAGISDADQSMIESVDYSRYFVVVAFYGSGTPQQDYITNIWQFKNDIWIKANFSSSTPGGENISAYQIIEINKTQMSSYGEITFRFLDDQFQEHAGATQMISSVAKSTTPPVSARMPLLNNHS